MKPHKIGTSVPESLYKLFKRLVKQRGLRMDAAFAQAMRMWCEEEQKREAA